VPTLPILPGLIQTAPLQAGLPAAAAPADPTADPNGGGTFLDQLAAALVSLAPAQPQPSVRQDDVPAEDGKDNRTSEQSEQTEQTDQTMADLAASFGLLPMPLLTPLASTSLPVQPTPGDRAVPSAMPATPQPATQAMPAPRSQASATSALAARPSTSATGHTVEPDVEAAQPVADQPVAEPAVRSDAAAEQTPSANTPTPAAANVAPGSTLPGADSEVIFRTPVPAEAPIGAVTQPVRQADTEHRPRGAADKTRADVVPSPDARLARESSERDEPRQAGERGTIMTTTAVAHGHMVQQLSAGSDTQAGGDPDGDEHAPQHESTPEPTSADQTVQPTPVPAVAGAAAANAPSAANAAHPREVVAQIAHQAELYRLPGGRGVRIELHPDGLGGVEVTLRYGAAGALELHVNVEQAATGALVESGWSDLRDALSQQGISPDRLVMSVSGPHGASLLSDSGSFGSGSAASLRSDAGAMGFGQSPSQGQQDRQPAPGRARWTPSVDVTRQELLDTAAPSSSRIDLRV
jgi:hypothetical protein